MGAEAFTMLTVLEARDRASEIVHRVDAALDKFMGTAGRAAGEAQAAGDRIDAGLLKTASGADALELASARVTAAETKMAAATKEQAAAEEGLLKARDAAAGEDELAAAADRVAVAEKRAAKAARELQLAQERQAGVSRAAAAETDAAAAATAGAGVAAEESSGHLSGLGKIAAVTALGMGFAGYKMVQAAGNFQDSTTHLVTDAGEAKSQLAHVQAGMLAISTATGTSAESISQGMYHIESSIPPMANQAQRANIALDDLRVAAEGAKVGGADLDTVAKTLTGTLNSYQKQGYTATQMMNALITTVGQGDMRMQDLASSLGGVAPAAAAAGIKFSDLGAAIATMTAQNMTASRATMDLNHTIGALENPTTTQQKEMAALGLSAKDLSTHLGSRGLSGTIDLISKSILSKMGPSGTVLLQSFDKAKQAGTEADQALAQMPATMRKLASSWASGATSSKVFDKAISALPPAQQTLYKQFESLTKKSGSFTDALGKGGPAAQTYNAALAKVMGGTVGLNTALLLSGPQMTGFKSRSDTIAQSLSKSGKSVDNWSTIQGTFNQKMATAKTAVQNTGIALGSALLPAVTKIANAVTKVLVPIATWISSHQKLAGIIFGSVASLAAFVASVSVARKGFNAIRKTVEDVRKAFGVFGKGAKLVVSGLRKVGGAAKSAGQLLGKLGGPAKKGLSLIADGSKAAWSGLGKLAGKASELASSAGRGIAAGAEIAANWAKAGVQAVIAAGRFVIMKGAQLAVAVAAKAQAAAQWLLNAAMDANPITLIIIALLALAAGFAYLWTHSAAFRDFWIGAWHDIQGAAQTVWGWLQDAFNGIMSLVSTVVGFVRSHWQLLLGIITGPIGLAVQLVTHYWHQISGFFSAGVHTVLKTLAFLALIPARVLGWMLGMAAAVGRGVASVVSWFAGLPGQAMKWLGQLASDAINAGVNFMQGLWNGLVSMSSWLYNQVIALVKDTIPGPILKILGISSPSKWAHWAGQMVGHGLANGILSTHAKVTAATQKLAGAVTGNLKPTVPGLGTLGAGAGGLAYGGAAGAGGTLELHLHMENAQIMSERDMDDLVNKIGRRLATVVGPAGGIKWSQF